jgi:pimeloyl-ACP methyl ester carboxylesterase
MFPSISIVGASIAVLAHTSLAQTVDWNSIQPSTSLNFTDCYDGARKCARLTVPLDWLNPDLNSSVEVHLAVIALPAVVSEDDPSFGGTIITNPGGPGGSGVNSVGGIAAEAMQLTADIDGEKHYEILSFDPRGVGESVPSADCWEDLLGRYMFQRELIGLGNFTATDETFARYLAKQKQFAEHCKLTGDQYEHDIRDYMSTTTVARDMLHIVDKLDELRNGPREESDKSRDLARIQYWGFSYGTTLGNYFASMFPGRVERMLLEGVVDVEDWAAGVSAS